MNKDQIVHFLNWLYDKQEEADDWGADEGEIAEAYLQEFSRLQSTSHDLPGESEFNAEIAMECIGLYSKQYDDEETGIHFKQRMDFLLTAKRLRSKALAVKQKNNELPSVEQLVHFLDWMNKTAAQNPMQFETDHDDIAMMYLADNPLPPPPVEKGGEKE